MGSEQVNDTPSSDELIELAVRSVRTEGAGLWFGAVVCVAVGIPGLGFAIHTAMTDSTFLGVLLGVGAIGAAAIGVLFGWIAWSSHGAPERLRAILRAHPERIRSVGTQWVETKLEHTVVLRRDLLVNIACDPEQFAIRLPPDQSQALLAMLRQHAPNARHPVIE